MTEFISVKQFAEKFNINLDTAYEYVHSEGFPKITIGRIIRIPVDKLEKWVEKRIQK